MAHSPTRKPRLTKNQTLVMEILKEAKGPLSDYKIVDGLRQDGFRAPLQVYRALDKLLALGLAHRLESLNAFVACRHPDCDGHQTVAFTICESCGDVTELSDEPLARRLKKVMRETHFALQKTTLELRGICQRCQSA